MRLDVLVYPIKDDETVEIDGEVYDLLATGMGFDHEDLILVRSDDSYLLYDNPDDEEYELIAEADDLEDLLDETEEEQIRWAMRREEVDDMLSMYSEYDDAEVYLDEIEVQEAAGVDMSEARAEYELVFGD